MNLAESFDGLQCIADWTFKTKFNKIQMDFESPIDRILRHAGPFARSLELMLVHKTYYSIENLIKIQETCRQLKALKLSGFQHNDLEDQSLINGNSGFVDEVEVLSLEYCCFSSDDPFFTRFTNLTSFNMLGSGITYNALKKCLRNNPGIRSFVSDIQTPKYLELLLSLPNLERLSLHHSSRMLGSSILLRLQSLRSVALYCNNEYINDTLDEFASKKDLVELELNNVKVSSNTFEMLKTFSNLQRLAITTRSYVLTSSNALPMSVKTLKLSGFQHLSVRRIVSLIMLHKNLENIHFANCTISKNRDIASIANIIVRKCNLEVEQRKLDLTLTSTSWEESKV